MAAAEFLKGITLIDKTADSRQLRAINQQGLANLPTMNTSIA